MIYKYSNKKKNKKITPEVSLFNDIVKGRLKRSIVFDRSIFGNSQ